MTFTIWFFKKIFAEPQSNLLLSLSIEILFKLWCFLFLELHFIFIIASQFLVKFSILLFNFLNILAVVS